jgi:hypothetical protein
MIFLLFLNILVLDIVGIVFFFFLNNTTSTSGISNPRAATSVAMCRYMVSDESITKEAANYSITYRRFLHF